MSSSSRQLAILCVALVLWALWDAPLLWLGAASYLAAWALFNWGGLAGVRWPALPRAAAWSLALLLMAGPVLRLLERARWIGAREGLLGIAEVTRDRWRLEATPSLAPPLVAADQPQTFYVHAPGAARVTLSFGTPLEATPLGHGVFRVAYDPRRDGVPEGPARIEVDGARFERDVTLVRPQAHPRWFSSHPGRGIAVTVSEETDELWLVDRDGGIRAVAVGDGPTDALLIDDGQRALVSHRYSPELYVIDVARAEVAARVSLGPWALRLAVSDSGRVLAIARDGAARGVTLLSLPELTPLGSASLPAAPQWLTFIGDDALALALRDRTLVRVARGDGGWALRGEALRLGRPVVTAARQPHGTRWLVATTGYRADGGMLEGNHFVEDQILTIDLERWAVVDQLLTARGGSDQGDPGVVTSGASPMGLAFAPDGALWVALAGSDELWRLPAGSHQPERLFEASDRAPLYAPHGVAHLGGGRWVASSPSQGVVGVFDEAGALLALGRLAPEDGALDAAALLRRRGERAFYESTTTGLSCQSCHLHGGDDRSAHDISAKGQERQVLKATLSTRGLAGTAPYLRNGSFPRIADLADVGRFPHARVVADRGASLEAYVASLALPLNPRALEGRDVARERRGLDVFFRARCPSCHAPPAFTNLSQHPLRALFPRFGALLRPAEVVDTPSLLGVWDSAPYLIDGRAQTLEAIFREHNPANRHGDTAALSDAELGDLIHFLEAL